MQGKSLAKSLTDRSRFVVVAEMAAGPNFNFAPIEKFLKAAKEAGPDRIPKSFDFVGVTAPQSPGGVANLEPADVFTRVRAADLLGSLDFIPHVTCKDHNSDAITSSLVTFRGRRVESVLCLTGDKPVRSQGVFEVESVGLLQLIQRMNDAAYLKASPGQWDGVSQLFPLAAVSPFKYSEASQMQQYYKMEKKIAAGAKALITQLGYDWRKSVELMRYLQENHIEIPVLGNVYLLTTTNPAPRLMHDGKLPGCFVSDDLLATLQREKLEDHVERAAQQVAMYQAIGAAGVDVGGLPDFDTFVKILSRAEQIGGDWEKGKGNLCWPGASPFYLYDDAGRRTPAGKPSKRLAQRCFNLTHRLILDPEHTGFKAGRGLLRALGAEKGAGFAYRSFATMEKAIKFAAFDCQDCGDCYLPENFGCCTMGGCEKGLSNAPCGDSTVDGKCGNNLDRICIGERIYDAAVAERDGVPRLRGTINQPRDPALRHTSSILNYLFARDHTKKSSLISIGDQLNASNPKTGKVMKEILALGDAAWSRPAGPVGYIRALIQSQADDGADYIAVNVDALSDEEGQLAVMMQQYIRLVRQWGRDVPVCIDSRFEDVLVAGLKEWYSASPSTRPPLLSSIRVKTADKLLPLKKEHDFSFVALLGDPTGGNPGIEDACEAAGQLFKHAVHQHGFDPGQIFFDPVSVPLVKDEPTLAGGRGRTYSAFETIRRLRTDSSTHRSHCLLRIDTAAGELPGRAIGVCRAYAAHAMQHGLDAAFVNPALHYGEEPADRGLLALVEAFAHMDGSPERARVAKELMAKFCAETQKPRKPAPASAPTLAKS
ncbi:MAG: methylenetetrahydrofolate reductase C-terminal domain-containing protein [Planctomycetes bacterium]|nr:methylenetetrahydrofolate reductase C-terminal domain-containing protein [Planctomycetota bacterium]